MFGKNVLDSALILVSKLSKDRTVYTADGNYLPPCLVIATDLYGCSLFWKAAWQTNLRVLHLRSAVHKQSTGRQCSDRQDSSPSMSHQRNLKSDLLRNLTQKQKRLQQGSRAVLKAGSFQAKLKLWVLYAQDQSYNSYLNLPTEIRNYQNDLSGIPESGTKKTKIIVDIQMQTRS